MATLRQFVCGKCGPCNAGNLFKALLARARGKSHRCPKCGHSVEVLQLEFDFGLGARHSRCTVLDCFTPTRIRKWRDGDNVIKFYPFLVVLKRHGKKSAVWLPYWHLVCGKDKVVKKYGQWAPFMDKDLFDDLMQQAKTKGHVFVS